MHATDPVAPLRSPRFSATAFSLGILAVVAVARVDPHARSLGRPGPRHKARRPHAAAAVSPRSRWAKIAR